MSVEEKAMDTIHYLACEYNMTLEQVSSKVASDVYNICTKLEK